MATEMKVSKALRDKLIALTRCASPDDHARPALCTVQFSAERAVACDSYVLGIVSLTDGPVEPRGVSAKELAAALRGAKHKKAESRIEFGDDRAAVITEQPGLFGTTRTRTDLEYLDGKYPDVTKLIPGKPAENPAGVAPAFNPKRLAQVAALADDHEPIRLRWQDELKPLEVYGRHAASAGERLLGIVMPVRV